MSPAVRHAPAARDRLRRRVAAAAMLAIAAVALDAAGAGGVSGAQPDLAAVPAEGGLRAAATVAEPAVVEVDIQISGVLRTVSETGPRRDLSFGGTGFFASPDGDVVTAAHLAAPTAEEIHQALVDAQIDAEQGCTRTTTDACSDVEQRHGPDLLARSTVEQLSTVLTVVTQTMGGGDAGLAAEVLSSSPSNERDIAVLRVHLAATPALLVAATNPAVGTPVAVEGYPESATATQVPVVTAGRILESRPGDPGLAEAATVLRTDARIEHGNSGGPAVDAAGEVVGIVSYGPSNTTNYLVSAADLSDVLRQAGVSNRLGSVDQLWRAGLAAERRGDRAAARDLLQRCADQAPLQVGCHDAADRLAGRPIAPPHVRVAGAAGVADTTALDGPRTLVIGILIGIAVGSGGTLLLSARARRRRERAATLPTGWWPIDQPFPDQPSPDPPAPAWPPAVPPPG